MKHETHWTAVKISRRLDLIAPLVYRERRPLPRFRYRKLASPEEPAPLADSGRDLVELPWNDYWGEWLADFALHGSFTVPTGWEDGPLALYLPLGNSGDFSHPEALVYVDGQAVAACDRHHQEILLPSGAGRAGEHSLLLHGWIGRGGFLRVVPGMKPFLSECALVRIDPSTRALVVAARVALGVVEQLDSDDPVRARLLNALNDAFMVLDTRHPLSSDFYSSVPEAYEVLQRGVRASGKPLDVEVLAVGHSHIDVAWLWTLQQTRRKARRTFSTVLRLMEEFPDYRFSQSQAQLYQYVQEDDPELFERIRQRVAEGRWEVMGGTWIEPDCNASGAESLARQFLLGAGYFRRQFGNAGTKVLWLPDSFGYAWCLPQLIREAGFEYFVTDKMSWNQYNRMPFQSLWWQGLDGSRVLTHLLTTPGSKADTPHRTTYNGDLTPRQVLGTWKNYRQKESHGELVTVYGHGDGGGGPTREMLEDLQRMGEHPGLPRVRSGTVREFFEGLEANSAGLPVWNGEFYLEYHRGTYTSQARTKRNNRKSEFLLHDAEFLAAWACLFGRYRYPHAELKRAWELVCLNQFHDILPGTSIGEVYRDAERDYAEVRGIGERVRAQSLAALDSGRAGALGPEGNRREPNSGGEEAEAGFLAVNPTSFGGIRYALLPEPVPSDLGLVLAESGAKVPAQAVEGGTLLRLDGLEPYSLTPLRLTDRATGAGKGDVASARVQDDVASARVQGDVAVRTVEAGVAIAKVDGGAVLENDSLRVRIDPNGDVVSIVDKEIGREVLAAGARANVFQLFEDRPLDYEAWDIEIYYDEKMWPAEPAYHLEVIEEGPLRVGLDVRRRLGGSEIRQRIYLHDHGKRIDFDTWIDWRERHTLLKVAFPVNVLSNVATYDIQWGNVERPTHRNTSWDLARFETYAYKWVDLSEGDYGVSLLNDCKHGYDVRDNVLRLTLLRGPTFPDAEADLGEHRFTYCLLPHSGDWRGKTTPESYAVNDPVFVCPATLHAARSGVRFLVRMSDPGVVIETVKRAENDDGVIVRLYENERRRGPVTLECGFELREAFRCNLLEDNVEPLEVSGRTVRFEIRPYQIVTLRLLPAT